MSLFFTKFKYFFSLFFLKNKQGAGTDYTIRVPVKIGKRKEISELDKKQKDDFVRLIERENKPRRIVADILDKTSSRR
jgi:hypothetical protein